MEKAIKIDGIIRLHSSFGAFKNPYTGESVIGFKYATDEQLYNWGFRNVIVPSATTYQRLGSIYYEEYIMDASGNTTGNYYTYPVIDFTQQEIDDYDQGILDNDIHTRKIYKLEDDGDVFFKRIKAIIERNVSTSAITQTQGFGFRKNLSPVIRPLREGDWDIAKENLDNMNTPADPTVASILSGITGMIDTYIIDNNI
jgi:hypothetical protein